MRRHGFSSSGCGWRLSSTVLLLLWAVAGCDGLGGEPAFTVRIDASPAEGGTVTPQGEVRVEGAQTLQARPAPGWQFARWEGDLQGTDNPATLRIDADGHVTAVFVRRLYDLSVETRGEGTVVEEVLASKQDAYPAGTRLRLTAVPAEGWRFVRWEGAVAGSDPSVVLLLEANAAVTAVFEPLADHFPLAVGHWWRYAYRAEYRPRLSGHPQYCHNYGWDETGEMRWEVTREQAPGPSGDRVFELAMTFTGAHQELFAGLPAPPANTPCVNPPALPLSETRTFTATVRGDSLFTTDPGSATLCLEPLAFQRFTTSQADSLSMTFGNRACADYTTVTSAPGTGILEVASWGGFGYRWSRLRLVESSLPLPPGQPGGMQANR